MSTLLEQALKLPAEDRRKLADDIYDSIDRKVDGFELSDEQKAEIDRRLAEYEKDPSIARPWEEVRERLRKIA
jgi:putative addiction module component (TIGR02574 family)